MKRKQPTVGILGAGQLALMLAEAAKKLDISVVCAGAAGDCAERVATVRAVDIRDAASVQAFAREVDVLTIETENIDASVLDGLNVQPNQRAIATAQDRLSEKRFFQECGIEVAPFLPVDSLADLRHAIGVLGLPAILKTRRMGYDGKGQARLLRAEDADAAWQAVGACPCILERMVAFDGEVSLIAARSATGEVAFYPLTENFHAEGILRMSVAPYHNELLGRQAAVYLATLLERLEYVGVLAVEFFVRGQSLLANEMAPRVHNSGHWTIEGAATSQFENHLRAILGMKLGPTTATPTVMLNCIGTMPSKTDTDAYAEIARHDYGKAARPGRKVGHLTLPADAAETIAVWRERLT